MDDYAEAKDVDGMRMAETTDTELIEFDSLELPLRIGTRREAIERRRLMTMLVPVRGGERARGGVGYVVKASNTMGETFALKRLRLVSASGENKFEYAQATAAFRQEYEIHRSICQTGFVPKLFGYATYNGNPAIVMEWVQGTTIRELLRRSRESGGLLPTRAVCGIGTAVLRALLAIKDADSMLIHRDISPANIMLRTKERSVSEQVESGKFDVCLIDFGSATTDKDIDTSFTVVEDLWRGATPDYAAPEMLGHDDPTLTAMRRSSAIDVYALCSVLYQLYSGSTPYRLSDNKDVPVYHLKTTMPPEPLAYREDDEGGALARAIMSGLSAEQDSRPNLRGLFDALQLAGPAQCASQQLGQQCEMLGGEGTDQKQLAYTEAGRTATRTPITMTYGTRLEVASRAEGARASDESTPESPVGQKAISRRKFVLGGVTVLAAVAAASAASTLVLPTVVRKRGKRETVAYSVNDKLYRVQPEEGGPWGFLNQANQWIIEPRFKGRVGNFNPTTNDPGSAYLAFVQDDRSGLFGYVSPQVGDGFAIEPKFYDVSGFFNGFAMVQNPDDMLWHYMAYSDGKAWVSEYGFAECRPFSGNYAAAKMPRENRWSYVSSESLQDGDCFGFGSFLDAGVVGDKLAPVALTAGNYGYITMTDDENNDEDPDDQDSWKMPGHFAAACPFSLGFAAVREAVDGLWAFIDTSGRKVIDSKFSDVQQFVRADNGKKVAAAKDPETRLWGFIDSDGNWVKGMERGKYTQLGSYERGLAAAQDVNGLWGFINSAGEAVIPFEFHGAGVAAVDGKELEPQINV